MNQTIVTEIVEFETVGGITSQDFIKTVDTLEKNFHSRQTGFIDTELIKGKTDCQWIMIQHWASMDDAKAVVRQMMKEPMTEEFRAALDPTKVKLSLLAQVKAWHK
jgi:heme-degrading monooxygenase HmoA